MQQVENQSEPRRHSRWLVYVGNAAAAGLLLLAWLQLLSGQRALGAVCALLAGLAALAVRGLSNRVAVGGEADESAGTAESVLLAPRFLGLVAAVVVVVGVYLYLNPPVVAERPRTTDSPLSIELFPVQSQSGAAPAAPPPIQNQAPFDGPRELKRVPGPPGGEITAWKPSDDTQQSVEYRIASDYDVGRIAELYRTRMPEFGWQSTGDGEFQPASNGPRWHLLEYRSPREAERTARILISFNEPKVQIHVSTAKPGDRTIWGEIVPDGRTATKP